MTKYAEMYKRAKEGDGLRTLTPKYHEWTKKGDQIIGAFVAKASVQSSSGPGTYNQYVFNTDDGPVKFHMGSATDAEVGEQFAQGIVYAIEYLGKEDIGGGRSVNKFSVDELGPTGASVNEVLEE